MNERDIKKETKGQKTERKILKRLDHVCFTKVQLVIRSILKISPYKILLSTAVLQRNWLNPVFLMPIVLRSYSKNAFKRFTIMMMSVDGFIFQFSFDYVLILNKIIFVYRQIHYFFILTKGSIMGWKNNHLFWRIIYTLCLCKWYNLIIVAVNI